MPKIQGHRKIVLEWQRLRGAEYPDVDLKADYMRIIPELWAQRLRLDASLNFEDDLTEAKDVLERIEDYMKAHGSAGGAPVPMDIGIIDQPLKTDQDRVRIRRWPPGPRSKGAE